jgi:localization factor PodJL
METSETDLAAVKPEEPAAPASAPPQESEVDPVLAAARDGDAEAQYEMAIRYRDGVGVDVSYGEAADWFDRAAQQGHVDAQANLGVMYRQGVGVPRDIDLAKLWLHAAARSGHADAQKYLGEVYAQDDLGTPDYFQAARWFREAAEQGLVDAQYNMGVLYEGGLGVPRDFEQAYYWFRLAARAGDETAEADVRRVIPLLTQEQRTEVDARVDAFTPASGENAATAPSDSGQTLTRRDQIRELQQLLVDRGYDPGEPDGLIGARTRDAIRQWQETQGLPETGQVTMQVLEGLRSGG